MERLPTRPRAAGVWLIAALAFFCALLARPERARTAPADQVARGLDLYLHVPDGAAPGTTLPIAALAIGFPTLTSTTPLSGATVEAAWDVETLGASGPATAPPSVSATTDERGRVVLAVPVPEGDPGKLALLVALRAAGKERVQRVEVQRRERLSVDLLLGDAKVVPGGVATAWALVRDLTSGAPRPGARVEVRLLEGASERHRAEATTDAGGTAAFRVPIPRSREPAPSWELSARLLSGDPDKAPSDSVRLSVREETPGAPRVLPEFEEESVRPGARAAYRIRLVDASDEPVPGTEIRVWTGPRTAKPPADAEGFRAASKALTTDLDGRVQAELAAPGVVPLGGMDLKVVARATVAGTPVSGENSVHVGRSRASVQLSAEAGELLPGVEQRLFLSLRGEDDAPLRGTFRLRADGLDATAKLDPSGEAEVAWKVPSGVGGFRGVGPCAGGVAAAVHVEAADDEARSTLAGARIAGWDDLPLCLQVERDAELLVRVEPPVARAGERVRVTVRGAKERGASILATTEDGARSVAAWAADAERGLELALPPDAHGLVHVHAAVPRKDRRALTASAAVLVRPAVLPRVEGRVVSGVARPGGTITVEATLDDGAGAPLPGTIAVVVIDRWGGGSFGGLQALDSKGGLCRRVGVRPERCGELLSGPSTLLARERLASVRGEPEGPARDPGAAVTEEAKATFRKVVHSLEGAVYEASNAEPSRLVDVRRKDGARWSFNPELLTLATAAMDPEPRTPGGEPITLSDLISMDRQVTFDEVARRVTRLKLYQVLEAIHEHRRSEGLLDPDEPALRDVAAMMRRLVRDGRLSEPMLLDPWGGRIAAFRTDAKDGLPFLRPAPGWEVRSPGPDGRLGNGDDVRDPFERVLDSGTPYAEAVDEDRIVDARLDMRVADATVSNWRSLIESLTGTSLGGLGLSGMGEGGGGSGQGYGSGSGRLGGAGRRTSSLPSGVAYWSGPRRTGPDGRLRIDVPLGDVETTWRVGLVAVPDGARPAFSTFDVASKLPLSARVDAGARWVLGDRVDVAIALKNRTKTPIEAALSIDAGGGLRLAGTPPPRAAVPAQGSLVVRVPMRAVAAGRGVVMVRASAPGVPEDSLRHEVEIVRAGEELVVSRAAFVQEEPVDLESALERPGLQGLGPATLVLERVDAGVLRAAVESLAPEAIAGDAELADAADVGQRVGAWATARLGASSPLALAAERVSTSAIGRLTKLRGDRGALAYVSLARAARAAPDDASRKQLGGSDECPKESAVDALPPDATMDLLDAEPALESGAMKPCWGAFIGTALSRLQEASDPALVARAVAALAERKHRAEDVRALTKRLAELVGLRSSGAIGAEPGARADRALVYAALLRAPPRTVAADRATLLGWLLVQRDARGSFGSSAATRAAVRAMLTPGGGLDREGPAVAQVDFGDGAGEHPLPEGRALRMAVPAQADEISVAAPRGGLLARVERRYLRPFATPALGADASLRLVVRWPEARVGDAAPVRIVVGQEGRGRRQADVRVHLPPGAHLAAPVDGVREVQGQLLWRATVGDRETFVEVPVRFDLAGQITIPEAVASDARGGSEPARAPARPFVVAPRRGR